jgi:hypothetical protein
MRSQLPGQLHQRRPWQRAVRHRSIEVHQVRHLHGRLPLRCDFETLKERDHGKHYPEHQYQNRRQGLFRPLEPHRLEAARLCGYRIPTLCYWNHGKCSLASCRVCLVEIRTARGGKLFASCVYPVSDIPAEKGFEIFISSPMAVKARRSSVELLLSNHSKDCQTCVKNGQCELLHVANVTGAQSGRFIGTMTPATVDMVAPGITRDTSKCIFADAASNAAKKPKALGFSASKTAASRPWSARLQ